MGAKSKIEWCDSTWNPITGCYHACEYCYARKIAQRFGAGWNDEREPGGDSVRPVHVLDIPAYGRRCQKAESQREPYPYGFEPTLHRYLLDQPEKWKKPRNIFVGSMADMWGRWIPDNWKIEVIEACMKAPQHNYIFLTKDPIGYSIWPTEEHADFMETSSRTENMWYGVTYTGTERLDGHFQEWEKGRKAGTWTNFWYLWRMSSNITPGYHHTFLSIEPLKNDICEIEDEREGGKLLENFLRPNSFGTPSKFFEWVIIGAETGNRKGKIRPEKEWVDKIVELCDRGEIPVFMKESLLPVMGEDNMRRDLPDRLKREG